LKLRLGYLNDGVIRDCVFSNLTMYQSTRGVRMELPKFIETKPDRGREASLIENLTFSNITMRDVILPLQFTVSTTPGTLCEAVRDISFVNVRAEGGRQLVFAGRKGNPLQRFSFTACSFKTAKKPEMSHCEDFTGLSWNAGD